MGRRSKKDRPPAIVQGVLADNLKRLRDRKFAEAPHETARNRLLAKASDTSMSQIQRIIAMDLAPGVDIVERLAGALEVKPANLLTPYFAAEAVEPTRAAARPRTGGATTKSSAPSLTKKY
jgi:hypothetical protein